MLLEKAGVFPVNDQSSEEVVSSRKKDSLTHSCITVEEEMVV